MPFILKTIAGFLIFSSGFIAAAQLTPSPLLPAEVKSFLELDTSRKIYISSINITGNKRTKDYIIRREMRVKQGDSLRASMVAKLIEESRSLVYNTTLFSRVEIIPYVDSNSLSVNVIVKEKWYIYPSPQFKLIDRNFNEWVKIYNADLQRVIYGVKFSHYNFTGRRDYLRFYLLTGYARNISAGYSAPYSNKKLTQGFSVSAGFSQSRETGYKTTTRNFISNYKEKGFVTQSFSASGAYIIRRGHYNNHVISAGYSFIKVDDSVTIKSNGDYFNKNKSSVSLPYLSYLFSHVHVDNISYPLKGTFYATSFLKRGTGIKGGTNLFEINSSASRFIPHKKNWYSSLQLTGKLKAPFNVAYINRHALGFNDFYLRGLENYVIDGVATAVLKYTLKKKIVSFDIPLPFHIKAFPKIPISIFAKTYADAGTSYIPMRFDTRLNNRLLYTSGFGIDVLTLYDISIRLEYSFNQIGENGLFLHAKGGF
ncbi:MAG: POTRA domain-containing protein [Ferruginibacter sp.]